MKILVSNFDYAFYTLNYIENIEAVNKFVDAGNMFVIATGRNITQLDEELMGFSVPYSILICNDGAVIYDSEGHIIYKNEINPQISEKIFHDLDREKAISETYIDNSLEHTINIKESSYKIIAKPKNYKKANVILEKLQEKYDSITGYVSESWIHIMSKDTNKGNGIDVISSYYGLAPQNIYTVGSSVNDISMMEKYSSFALDDTEECIKKYAKKSVPQFKDVIDFLLDES